MHPENAKGYWMPAFAGMTAILLSLFFTNPIFAANSHNIYDAKGNVMASCGEEGCEYFIYQGVSRVGVVKNNQFTHQANGIDGKAGEMIHDQNGIISSQLWIPDFHGSVIAKLDTKRPETILFDAFGDVLNEEDCQDYHYTDKPRIGCTSLHNFNARFYDPQLGRFTTTDPLEQAYLNWYVYTSNDPVNRQDATGTSDTPTQSQCLETGIYLNVTPQTPHDPNHAVIKQDRSYKISQTSRSKALEMGGWPVAALEELAKSTGELIESSAGSVVAAIGYLESTAMAMEELAISLSYERPKTQRVYNLITFPGDEAERFKEQVQRRIPLSKSVQNTYYVNLPLAEMEKIGSPITMLVNTPGREAKRTMREAYEFFNVRLSEATYYLNTSVYPVYGPSSVAGNYLQAYRRSPKGTYLRYGVLSRNFTRR